MGGERGFDTKNTRLRESQKNYEKFTTRKSKRSEQILRKKAGVASAESIQYSSDTELETSQSTRNEQKIEM